MKNKIFEMVQQAHKTKTSEIDVRLNKKEFDSLVADLESNDLLYHSFQSYKSKNQEMVLSVAGVTVNLYV